MAILLTIVIISALVLIALYLLLRFNRLWIYRLFDRALTNQRNFLPREYELPRYFTRNAAGGVDTSARWPGWDGWYFFMLPDDQKLPVKMIRCSLMTGLYGLDGVDNYEQVLLRLSTLHTVEHLTLIPTQVRTPKGAEKTNYLAHHYLPRSTDLAMKAETLDVSISGVKPVCEASNEQYGRIQGAWPNYQIDFLNPEAEIKISLSYRGEKLVWWADVSGVFTYFAAFGSYDGTITYARGTSKTNPSLLTCREETYALKGRGCFEHGFARKASSFNRLWSPVRWIGAVAPSFKPVRYHYELFIDDGGLHGGFMFARAFGVDFRNRGGFYQGDDYVEIGSVKIKYFKDQVEQVATCSGRDPVPFPRKWQVRAMTRDGILEYTGEREWPLAAVSSNMMYYNFSYTGRYKGQPISGRGYGEYLNI